MKKLLVLARGDGSAFTNILGESVIKDFPTPIVVFAEKTNAHFFSGLGDNVEVEIVRYYDEPGIFASAARIHEEHGLLGVAALAESAIELAAGLREKLGLPGMHVQGALRFRDKLIMKQVLGAAGVRVPEHAECADRERVELLLARHGRLVIKPVDGLGSREVVIIDSATDLDAWYAKGKTAGFEAEEYVDGTLYHINAVVHDGRSVLVASAPYLPGMANIDFASGAPFVSAMLTSGELKDRLEAFSSEVLDILGMRHGVTHMECFLKADGEIVFCEVAARPGGGGIVLMMEAQYGVNYARASLLLEAGRGDLISLDGRRDDVVTGLMGFRHPQTGFVKRIAKAEVFPEDWIHHVKIDKQVGDFVVAAAHCTDYIGLLIFSAPDLVEFERKRVDLYQRFYAELETQAV